VRPAPGSKKSLHHFHATRGQHARGDFHPMVELGMIKDLQHGMNGASLRVLCSVDEAANAGVRDGSGTHRARFHGDVEIAIPKAIVADGLPSFAQREDFRMGRRIVSADGPITAPPDNPAFVNHDGAHRHLAEREGSSCFAQRLFHPEFVGFGHDSCEPLATSIRWLRLAFGT
jgi:hypothetical protein